MDREQNHNSSHMKKKSLNEVRAAVFNLVNHVGTSRCDKIVPISDRWRTVPWSGLSNLSKCRSWQLWRRSRAICLIRLAFLWQGWKCWSFTKSKIFGHFFLFFYSFEMFFIIISNNKIFWNLFKMNIKVRAPALHFFWFDLLWPIKAHLLSVINIKQTDGRLPLTDW